MTASELLRASKAAMQAKGWGQKQNENPSTGALCVEGALLSIHASFEDTKVAANLVIDALGSRDVIGWNDNPARTKDDVMELWDRAIWLADREEIWLKEQGEA